MESGSRPDATAPPAPALAEGWGDKSAEPMSNSSPPAKRKYKGEDIMLVIFILSMLCVELVFFSGIYRIDDGEISALIATFDEKRNPDDTYSIIIVNISQARKLESFNFYLKDENDTTQKYGEIALQNISGRVQGIESEDTWDVKYPEGDADLAARAYDVEHESDTCDQDRETKGRFPVIFHDHDHNEKLSVGDEFIIRGVDYSDVYEAESGWEFLILHIPTGDFIGSIILT